MSEIVLSKDMANYFEFIKIFDELAKNKKDVYLLEREASRLEISREDFCEVNDIQGNTWAEALNNYIKKG